jgi:simple sugar transport system substrate-binding protein
MVTHQPPGDTFWDIVQTGAKAAAAKDNIDLTYASDPNGGQQATLVQNAIASKVDAIAVTLAHPAELSGAMSKARAAGIPVVALNSGFDRWQQLGAIMYMGQDEGLAGEAAGRRLAQEGAKHVICIAPEQGNVSIEARCDGAKKAMTSGTVETLYVNGTDLPSVQATIGAKLQQDPSIDYVLAQGAPSALASVKSVQDAHSKAKIVAFDLSPDLVKAIQSGQIQWTIDQQPYVQGYEAIDSLWLYLNNGNILGGGGAVLTGPTFVDKDNIGQVAKFASAGTR